MRYLARLANREIWVEHVPMAWRHLPVFMGMFPEEGRSYILYRDPRAVLASWKVMSFMPDNLYLNQLFNWIDSISHLQRCRELYDDDQFLSLRFEDIHRQPEKTVASICRLMNVEVEPQLLQPERWPELFDPRFTEANLSAHDGKRRYGFDPKLIDNWQKVLEPWELALVELLAGPLMDSMGYERSGSYKIDDVRKGLDMLRRQPFLLRNLQVLLSTGEGTQDLPNDPTKPENWGGTDGFSKFMDSPAFQRYVKDQDAIEALVQKKYGEAA